MQIGQVKIGDIRQITRYNSNVDRRKRCQLSSVDRTFITLSASTFVCSTFVVMQRVARVHRRQLIYFLFLVLFMAALCNRGPLYFALQFLSIFYLSIFLFLFLA